MSMYSLIPNENPFCVKLSSLILFSTDFNNLTNNSLAFSPRSVTNAPIGKSGLILKFAILRLAFALTAFIPDICSSKRTAFSTSAVSVPAPMFNVTLSINISLFLFIVVVMAVIVV